MSMATRTRNSCHRVCSISDCLSRFGDADIRFFQAGAARKRCTKDSFAKWKLALKRNNRRAIAIKINSADVCSLHFDDTDYSESDKLKIRLTPPGTYRTRPNLKPEAFPHLNLPPGRLKMIQNLDKALQKRINNTDPVKKEEKISTEAFETCNIVIKEEPLDIDSFYHDTTALNDEEDTQQAFEEVDITSRTLEEDYGCTSGGFEADPLAASASNQNNFHQPQIRENHELTPVEFCKFQDMKIKLEPFNGEVSDLLSDEVMSQNSDSFENVNNDNDQKRLQLLAQKYFESADSLEFYNFDKNSHDVLPTLSLENISGSNIHESLPPIWLQNQQDQADSVSHVADLKLDQNVSNDIVKPPTLPESSNHSVTENVSSVIEANSPLNGLIKEEKCGTQKPSFKRTKRIKIDNICQEIGRAGEFGTVPRLEMLRDVLSKIPPKKEEIKLPTTDDTGTRKYLCYFNTKVKPPELISAVPAAKIPDLEPKKHQMLFSINTSLKINYENNTASIQPVQATVRSILPKHNYDSNEAQNSKSIEFSQTLASKTYLHNRNDQQNDISQKNNQATKFCPSLMRRSVVKKTSEPTKETSSNVVSAETSDTNIVENETSLVSNDDDDENNSTIEGEFVIPEVETTDKNDLKEQIEDKMKEILKVHEPVVKEVIKHAHKSRKQKIETKNITNDEVLIISCTECKRMFLKEEHYEAHREALSQVFLCHICDGPLVNTCDIHFHFYFHSTQQKINYVVLTETDYNLTKTLLLQYIHYFNGTHEGRFQCPCGFVCLMRIKLIQHIEKNYEKCKESIALFKSMGRKPRGYSKPVRKSFTRRKFLNEPPVMPTVPVLLKCRICDLEFYNRYDYLEHVRFAHNQLFTCDFCQYKMTFTNKKFLHEHINAHLRKDRKKMLEMAAAKNNENQQHSLVNAEQ